MALNNQERFDIQLNQETKPSDGLVSYQGESVQMSYLSAEILADMAFEKLVGFLPIDRTLKGTSNPEYPRERYELPYPPSFDGTLISTSNPDQNGPKSYGTELVINILQTSKTLIIRWFRVRYFGVMVKAMDCRIPLGKV